MQTEPPLFDSSNSHLLEGSDEHLATDLWNFEVWNAIVNGYKRPMDKEKMIGMVMNKNHIPANYKALNTIVLY